MKNKNINRITEALADVDPFGGRVVPFPVPDSKKAVRGYGKEGPALWLCALVERLYATEGVDL